MIFQMNLIKKSECNPSKKCNHCKYFLITNDPNFYIDSFDYICTKEAEIINKSYNNPSTNCKYFIHK